MSLELLSRLLMARRWAEDVLILLHANKAKNGEALPLLLYLVRNKAKFQVSRSKSFKGKGKILCNILFCLLVNTCSLICLLSCYFNPFMGFCVHREEHSNTFALDNVATETSANFAHFISRRFCFEQNWLGSSNKFVQGSNFTKDFDDLSKHFGDC